MTAIQAMDFAAVFVFALSGALSASRAQLDPVGFVFLAALTGLGGGTTRDLVLDRTVFWTEAPAYLTVATAAAVLIFFTAHLAHSRLNLLRWLDALALSVAVPAGLAVAMADGASWPVALLMGVITGTFGGLLRDVVVNDVPVVLAKGEIYVTAGAIGGGTGLSLYAIASPDVVVFAGAGLATFGCRAVGIWFGWRLPTHRGPPPR